jgi:hypothetical protein
MKTLWQKLMGGRKMERSARTQVRLRLEALESRELPNAAWAGLHPVQVKTHAAARVHPAADHSQSPDKPGPQKEVQTEKGGSSSADLKVLSGHSAQHFQAVNHVFQQSGSVDSTDNTNGQGQSTGNDSTSTTETETPDASTGSEVEQSGVS